MKRALFALLKIIGVFVILFVLAGMFGLVAIIKVNRKADRAAAKIQPGMTVQQFVENFPMDFDFGSIGVTDQSEGLCISPEEAATLTKSSAARGKTNKAKPHLDTEKKTPAGDRVPFPPMRTDDPVTVRLAGEAAQSTHSMDRFLALDRHLASQNDYKTASDLWTFYLQDNPTEAHAYCERAGAYQHQRDFFNAYKDVKKSCGLGDDSCCYILRTLPGPKAQEFEKQESTEAATSVALKNETKRNAVPVKVCTVPASVSARSLMVSRNSREDDKFKVNFLGSDAPPEILSRPQFLELLNKEYQGHEWRATFTYLTATPQHISFRILVGPGGKVKQKDDPHGWD